MHRSTLVFASLACLSLAACGGASPAVRSAEPTVTVPSSDASASLASPAVPRAAGSQGKQLVPPWSMAASPSPSAPLARTLVSSTPASTDAGQRVLEAAYRMIEARTIVRGSCYRYIDAVFTEAGYDGWRRQTTEFRGRTRGPFADLDLIQPGDWLYIVNHPDRRPVGTHSVIFVRWIDRPSGYAETVSYPGGRAEIPGNRRPYDVSRTYRIQRAVDPG